MKIASIVEGHGEMTALPALLRRFNEWKPSAAGVYGYPLTPVRVRRDRFLNREDEFRKQLLLAAAKCGENGWILVVLDADDDCPAELAADIYRRAQEYVGHRDLSVVLANREFEAWFIAAAQSLNNCRGFSFRGDEVVDAEKPRDAKGWMGSHMAEGKYRETLDQPAFAVLINLDEAFENSRSFQKLCKEWVSHIL